MIKPELCHIHVKHCEDCSEWEPLPYHNNGGLCMLSGNERILVKSGPEFSDTSTGISTGGMKFALEL